MSSPETKRSPLKRGEARKAEGDETLPSVTTRSDNHVWELVLVKVLLRPSLLNVTKVTFNILPVGRCAPMTAPRLPFTAVLEWPLELSSYQNLTIKFKNLPHYVLTRAALHSDCKVS